MTKSQIASHCLAEPLAFHVSRTGESFWLVAADAGGGLLRCESGLPAPGLTLSLDATEGLIRSIRLVVEVRNEVDFAADPHNRHIAFRWRAITTALRCQHLQLFLGIIGIRCRLQDADELLNGQRELVYYATTQQVRLIETVPGQRPETRELAAAKPDLPEADQQPGFVLETVRRDTGWFRHVEVIGSTIGTLSETLEPEAPSAPRPRPGHHGTQPWASRVLKPAANPPPSTAPAPQNASTDAALAPTAPSLPARSYLDYMQRRATPRNGLPPIRRQDAGRSSSYRMGPAGQAHQTDVVVDTVSTAPRRPRPRPKLPPASPPESLSETSPMFPFGGRGGSFQFTGSAEKTAAAITEVGQRTVRILVEPSSGLALRQEIQLTVPMDPMSHLSVRVVGTVELLDPRPQALSALIKLCERRTPQLYRALVQHWALQSRK